MSLKLFRSTGYSSILTAGETRVKTHPGWIILVTSAWVGFACNAALWRALRGPAGGGAGLAQALTFGAFMGAACAIVLSMLGWRKTLKPAATLILFMAALAVSANWEQAASPKGKLDALPGLALPAWTALLQWQVWATLAGLALFPAIWVGKTQVRRLAGNDQLGVNMIGVVIAGAVLALSGFVLFGS